MFLELRECKARSNSVSEGSKYLLTPTSYDVSVKSINCVCARTNKQFILIDTPNTENEIKWCEHAILWEFEVFEDCGNCIAMEQSGYISEWQNLLLALTSSIFDVLSFLFMVMSPPGNISFYKYTGKSKIFQNQAILHSPASYSKGVIRKT